MVLPLFRKEIRGKPLSTTMIYSYDEKDEVEDLYCLLRTVKQHHPDLEGFSNFFKYFIANII